MVFSMLAPAIVDRCRDIVRNINIASDRCGAFVVQGTWQSTKGGPLYGAGHHIEPSAIDEKFILRDLPFDRRKFAGLPIDTCGTSSRNVLPSPWLDVFGIIGACLPIRILQYLGTRGWINWPLMAFARAARKLPPEYICDMPRYGWHPTRSILN